MQVVPGAQCAPAASDACAGSLALAMGLGLLNLAEAQALLAAPAPAPHPCPLPSALPRAKRRKKKRKPLDLAWWESERLTNKLRRVVCSSRWEHDLKGRILEGDLPYKEDQAKELYRVGAYPPGGAASVSGTRMRSCACCGQWTPRGRFARELEIVQLDGGQVRRKWGPWKPVCDDCFIAEMPLQEMVQQPSSPGFSRRFNNGELAAHLEGSGFYLHTKRRRVLTDRGELREFAADEDGTVHELAGVVNHQPGAPAAAPAVAGNEAA